MDLKRLFEPLQYEENKEFAQTYESSARSELLFRYHGMGNYQVIGVNPKRNTMKKRYFLGVVGGQNGFEVESNEKDFRNLNKYYTLEELCYQCLRTYNLSPYCS